MNIKQKYDEKDAAGSSLLQHDTFVVDIGHISAQGVRYLAGA